MNIYQLSEAYQHLQALVDEEGDDGAWEQALNDLRDEASVQIGNLGRVWINLRAEREAIEYEIDRVAKRAKAVANHQERVRQAIKGIMERFELQRVREGVTTVSLVPSPPAVEILSDGDLPIEFKVGLLKRPLEEFPLDLRPQVEVSYNRRALAEALGQGGVPGAQLVRGKHVVIR